MEINYVQQRNELQKKVRKLSERISELEVELLDEKNRRQFSENETALVKGVNNSSPEMKKLKEENEKLKADLARSIEERQFDNLVHTKELKDIMKKKNYFHNIHWRDDPHLSHIYWSIVEGRKSKEKFLELQKLDKEENERW